MNPVNKFLLFLVFSGSFFLASCHESDDPVPSVRENFDLLYRGLEGLRVHELKIVEDKLFAMTSDGIYRSEVGGGELQLFGLKGKNIVSAVVFSADELLASFWDDAGMSDRIADLYYTTDGGSSWVPLAHNFGGEVEEPVFHFAWNPEEPEKILATGYQVVAQSTDKGLNWTPIWGDFDMFANRMRVFINPENPDEVWAGGQGGIENGYLVHLRDGEEIGIWNDLVPNPTTVKKVVFDRQVPQSVYVGWEGELARTQDNGQTWQTLIDRHEEAHFFFGIATSALDPAVVVAAKWAKTDAPQLLEIMYSTDKGQSWTSVPFEGVQYGGVQDLLMVSAAGKEHIYVGLDKGGVYEITWNR